jgi:hypothetical protein
VVAFWLASEALAVPPQAAASDTTATAATVPATAVARRRNAGGRRLLNLDELMYRTSAAVRTFLSAGRAMLI